MSHISNADLQARLALWTGPAVVMVPGNEMRAIANELLTLRAADADRQAQGWIICPPDCVPKPRNADDAKGMKLLGTRYLEGREIA